MEQERDELLIAATIAEAGHARRWLAECGKQDARGYHRTAARLRWRDNGEYFLAIRHRSSDGTTVTELLSAEATPAGRDQIESAADALEIEFGRQAGFERLLEALRG